jgi:hypothetical protein
MYNHFHQALGAPFAGAFIALLVVIILGEIILKGYALWHSARNKQKAWFIVLLIIHTAGILDAIYLIWFREDKNATRVSPPPAVPPTAPSSASAA